MKLVRLLLAIFLLATLLNAKSGVRSAGRFIVISDIHFNPLADPALAKELMTVEPGNWEALFSSDTHSPAQAYNEDSTWSLFRSLLSEVRSLQPRPKLIIVTGDVLAHKLRDKFAAAVKTKDPEAYRLFVKNTFTFIALQLQKAANGFPVIYTIGNNDDECGDYALQPDGPFLADTAEVVANMARINPADLRSWTNVGSYVVGNPLANHHEIISLNTVFLSRRYSNTCVGNDTKDDPGDVVLTWLSNQLEYARKHGTKVWLVYHIPPGIDGHTSSRNNQVTPMWKPRYAEAFNSLLDQYRKTIELNLAGHTHLDDFRLVKTPHTTTLVLLTPGLSPNVAQNPAFRIVIVDSHGHPQDLEIYYLPYLDSPKWKLEYSARAAFNLRAIDVQSFRSLYRRIDQLSAVGNKWRLYYAVSRPESLSNSKSYVRSLYCATGHTDPEAFRACLSTP